MNTILFVIAIFFAVWSVSLNIGRFIRGNDVPGINIIIMAIALTAVITHILGIW